MRLALIAIMALALSGCWVGEGLFVDSDAQQPLQEGVYRSSQPGKVSRITDVAILPSGLTRISERGDSGEEEIYGFLALDEAGSRYVAWFNEGPQSSGKPAQIYFLLRRTSRGFSLAMPDCQRDAQVAREAGAVVDVGDADTCTFKNRESLIRAMQGYDPKPNATMMQLERVR